VILPCCNYKKSGLQLLATSFVLALTISSAQAAVIGVRADRTISSPCVGLGNNALLYEGMKCGPNIQSDRAYDAGLDRFTADIGQNAIGSAHVLFDADSGLPVLKGSAFTNANEGIFVGAEAARKFVYTGADNFQLTVTGNLHGLLAGGTAEMWGAVALFRANGSTDPFGNPTGLSDVLLDELGNGNSLSGYIGEALFPDAYDGTREKVMGEHNLGLSVSMQVNSGDEFWVWASFQASAADGSSFNGLNTGTFGFNTTYTAPVSGTPTSGSVPEPGTLVLLGMGLVGWVGSARKK